MTPVIQDHRGAVSQIIGSLSRGHTFMFDGYLFIIYEYFASSTVEAIRLDNGKKYIFQWDDRVQPVDVQINILRNVTKT